MTDEFLSALQKDPSPEFTRALYERLAHPRVRRRLMVWRAVGLLALLAVAAAGAWQWTRPRYERVGEIWVHIVPVPLSPQERARLHGEALPPFAEESPASTAVPPAQTPSVEFLFVDPSLSPFSVPEARSRFEQRYGDALVVPSWAPQSFSGGDDVVLYFTSLEGMNAWADALVEWTNGEGHFIVFMARSLMEWDLTRQAIVETPAFVMFEVPLGGFDQVEVRGHAAVLLEEMWGLAGWPGELRNERREVLMLFWEEGSTLYWLQAPRELVTAEDLIHMADSTE